MRDDRIENEKLEDFLRKAYLPEALPQLRQRITAEARKAWNQTTCEVSWLIPLRRLAASAAAVVFIILLTNYSSGRVLEKWQSGESFASKQLPAELEALPEIPYSPFAKYLATAIRKPSAIDPSALRDHVETVRRALDDSQHDGTSISPAPSGGSSLFVPARNRAGSYSYMQTVKG